MKIDIVIPTYKRKDKLLCCLNSITTKYNCDIYLYFDNNDEASFTFFRNGVNEFYCQLMGKQYRAFGIWNYHLKNLTSDAMIYLCDDVELLPNSLDNLIKEFNNRFPNTDGVVTFNQINIKGGSKSAMGLIGRKFAERYSNRQCFCPDYVSFYADSEVGDYAEKINKFYYCEEAKLIHYHPAFYKNEVDEAHRQVRDKEANLDKVINAERKKLGLLWGKSFKLIRNTI